MSVGSGPLLYSLAMKFLASLLLVISLSGCATTQTSVPRPGSISAFDSDAATILETAKATIDEAKKQFPPPVPEKVRVVLNPAIEAYNLAAASWQLYHAQAAGAPSLADLQAQLATLKTAIAAVGK